MSLANDYKLTNYIRHCDNSYSVVNNIAQIAREKSSQAPVHILESEALTWAIQNVEPENIKECRTNEYYMFTPYQQQYIKDELYYISDNEIRTAVRHSLIKSKKYHYLIYVYNNIDNADKKARVRVITRMIYDHINS